MNSPAHTRVIRRAVIGIAACAALVAGLLHDSAHAAEQDQFNVYELSVEGWVLASLAGDFNGDNLTDIAILYLPTQSQDERRFAGLFIQSRESGFSSRPTHITPLPPSASQFQVIDTDADGKAEIVFVDNLGVQSLGWQATGFQSSRRLARRETVFRAGEFLGALTGKFAFELNGQPRPEFVTPTAGGMAIFEAGENGAFDLLNEIELRSRGAHSRAYGGLFKRNRKRSYMIETPEILAADANLDGRIDLYFIWNDRLNLFLQDETGAYPRTPDAQIRLTPVSWDGDCHTIVLDCNGDRRPDVVALRTRGGIASAECKVDFYMTDQTGKPPALPGKTLTVSQARTSLILTDVNGDNVPELALPAVELGTVSTIKMMMQRKGGVYLLVYPLTNGLPGDEATMRKKLDFALDYEAEAPDQEILFDWSADYNNDGFKDLVYTDGGGNLEIYFGAASGFLEENAAIEAPIADVAYLWPMELNHDGRTDLLIDRVNSGRVNGVWALLSK